MLPVSKLADRSITTQHIRFPTQSNNVGLVNRCFLPSVGTAACVLKRSWLTCSWLTCHERGFLFSDCYHKFNPFKLLICVFLFQCRKRLRRATRAARQSAAHPPLQNEAHPTRQHSDLLHSKLLAGTLELAGTWAQKIQATVCTRKYEMSCIGTSMAKLLPRKVLVPSSSRELICFTVAGPTSAGYELIRLSSFPV